MSVIEEIAAERRRQIEVEGWTPEHDDEHSTGEMAEAAACYVMAAVPGGCGIIPRDASLVPTRRPWLYWPWDRKWFKPTDDRRRQLVKAGALIIAEIERLDRKAAVDAAKAKER